MKEVTIPAKKRQLISDMIMRKELRLTHRQALVNLIANTYRNHIALYGEKSTSILLYSTARNAIVALQLQLEQDTKTSEQNREYIQACIEWYESMTSKQATRLVKQAWKKAIGE